ncbi:M81 family metallopeptidase [Stappia sp. TSB10P1A]|uniref:M81 family metallopeptidase n=1 Tax=Stappia sp. TSB10P1A TaxID=2003585 RepID=UPI0016438959|nr:M81 family metallopeptidase [Stappia sp. TSB10P1A]
MRRLAIARLWHEANAFSPVPTGLESFRRREWQAGPQARAAYRGTATEMGGTVAFLDARPDWQGVFLRCTSAPPGGFVEQAALDAIHDEIVAGLAREMAQAPLDAVYVSLHGALAGTRDPGPDRTLLARIRAAIGPLVPLAVSFDLHACLDPRSAESADIVVGYKTYPHVDMVETAEKALGLLERMVQGERFRSLILPVPMLPPSHSMRTDGEPMGGLVRLAAEREAEAGLADVTVFGGFAYADTPWTSAAITVCHRDEDDGEGEGAGEGARASARAVAQGMADALLRCHGAFLPDLPGAAEGLARATRLLETGTRWPVAVLENSDNPLSGGAGDTPGLFRALVEAAPPWPALFASFCDPDLVARAHELGAGARLEAALGGRLGTAFGPPVPFSGEIVRLTDGRFVNTGPMERGRPEAVGRTVLLRAGNVSVVVAETAQSVNDPAWAALHGIDLGEVALFCTKAKNHFRAAFGTFCGAIIDVDTPGPAPADLTSLPYRHVPASFLRPDAPPECWILS